MENQKLRSLRPFIPPPVGKSAGNPLTDRPRRRSDSSIRTGSGGTAPAGITGINAKKIQWWMMARCEHCGNECALPFTCQHCRGAFCPECRLPPSHQCTGITSWKKKPAPGVGISYGRGGTATAIPGGSGTDVYREKTGRTQSGIPWLVVMIAVMIIIMLGILFLVLSG